MMENARAGERRFRISRREGGDDLLLAGGMGGGGGRPVQARLSNLHHYAVTGVKAQAFVLVMFLCRPICLVLYELYQ
jgi:hypothetical protein